MQIDFRFSQEAELIARLNEPVQDLHYQLHPEYFKPFSFFDIREFLTKRFAEGNYYCLIASVGRSDVGYALFYINNYPENAFKKAYKGIHIDQICVLPEYKGRGIGKAIMDEIDSFAKKENAYQIELTHWDSNEEAKQFYQSLGFRTNLRFVVKKCEKIGF